MAVREGCFQKEIMKDWLQAQSKVPYSMYLQPSENTGTQTQHSTRTESLRGFYSENLGPSKTLTQQKNIKQQFLSSSSSK